MSWPSANGLESYRYLEESDLDDLSEMLSDPEVGRYLWFTPLPAEAVRGFFVPYIEQQQRHVAEGTMPQTAVFAVNDPHGLFLGQGAVVAVDGSPGGFEIGFQLCRAAWGRGVGKRLARFLVAFAVTHCDPYRLQGSCLEGNTASRRLLEGLGLVHEGTRPGFRLKEETRHTELDFGARVEDLDQARIADWVRESRLDSTPG